LPERRFGDEVRLEVADNCPPDLVYFLREQFHLDARDVYQCHGPVNLHRLMAVPDLVDRPDLKFQPFTPGIPTTPVPSEDWFDAIRQGDILLHHPYQSFAPVTEFLRQAATDPHVLTIKQTLYRTGADSAIVQSLVDAARGGKEVTVVIELRARFDEEANIELAHDLEEAGAHVVYGVVGHQNPRQNESRTPAGRPDAAELYPSRNRQLSRPQCTALYRFRTAHLRCGDRTGRPHGVPATHLPGTSGTAQTPSPIAVYIARHLAEMDRP
jgi:hypothetical protein